MNTIVFPQMFVIKEKAVIEAIVDLPIETFASSKSGEKTSVLYLRKKDKELVQGNIFLAIAYKAGVDHRGNPCDNQLEPQILNLYRKFCKTSKDQQTGLLSSYPVALAIKPEELSTSRFYPS